MSSSIVYDTLNLLVKNCMQYFTENCNHASAESILKYLGRIENNLQYVQPIAKDFIGKYAHKYDVVPGLEANGYRSLLAVLEALLLAIIGTLRSVEAECRNMFFRGNAYINTLATYSDILHQLRGLLYYAQILIGLTPNGELFVDENASEPLMHDCEIMAKACFYGSLHGFQYCGGMQPVVQSMSAFVASYNDVHKPNSTWNTFKSAINSGRYLMSAELRGEKLEKVYNGGDLQFFKKFWSLHEQGIVKAIPNFVGTSVQVNKIFEIPPDTFSLKTSGTSESEVDVSFTSSLGDPKCINARLISAVLREGQNSTNSPSKPDAGFDKSKMSFRKVTEQPKSKNLLFFCHGGGFVALTSKSYELIHRQWSQDLQCPIFSVDYSLAPEAPFPEAFEECFFAYAWALKHADMLGTTAENIVFAGDSAGGNLVLSVALRAALYGIQLPNSIVTMYPAGVVRYSASPARLLSVMDPLLPLGVLSGCLGAYSGVKTEKIKRESRSSYPDRPISPSKQQFSVNLFSNFFKDVEEGFSRMRHSPLSTERKEHEQTWWDEEFEVLSSAEINEGSDETLSAKGEVSNNTSGIATSSAINGPDNNSNGVPDNISEKISISSDTANVEKSSEQTSTRQSSGMSKSTSKANMDFRIKLPHNFQPLKSKFCGDNFQMHQSPVVRNAFISPALASDELMQKLPYVDIVGCEFDPLFDDSVVLAKRLEALKKPYQFHVVRGLPHGFLNLQISSEPKKAAKMCLERIKAGLERIPAS